MGDQETDFCDWDARSRQDFIVLLIVEIIAISILIFSLSRIPSLIRFYKSDRDYNDRGKTVMLIHLLVILWGLVFVVLNGYSIIVYSFFVGRVQTNYDMLKYTRTYASIHCIPGFLVQTLFIFICLKFCRNVVQKLQIKSFPSYSFKFVRTMRIYFYFRIILFLTINFGIIISSNQSVTLFTLFGFVYLAADALVVNIFLIGALRIFINRITDDRLKKLRRQYLIMLACSIIRIFIDTIYVVLSSIDFLDKNCVNQNNPSTLFTILNAFSNLLMHLTPIIVILIIYTYRDRRRTYSSASELLHGQENSIQGSSSKRIQT